MLEDDDDDEDNDADDDDDEDEPPLAFPTSAIIGAIIFGGRRWECF